MKCILYGLMKLEAACAVSRQLCFVLDLVNDAALIQEYCRMHEPGSVWLPMRRIFTLADHRELSRS